VGFEPTISVLEWAKIVDGLDRSAAVFSRSITGWGKEKQQNRKIEV
jgi:hypothetical protein